MSRGAIWKRCGKCNKRVDGRRCECGYLGSSWCFAVDVPSPDGRRKQNRRSGFPTKDAAEKAMREQLASVDAGSYAAPSRVTVAGWLDEWLPTVQGQVRGSTFISYRSAAGRVKEAIGAVPLQSLNKAQVMKLYGELRETGHRRTGGRLAYQTVANVHIALRKALGDAVEAGIINRNPATKALKLMPDPVEMKVWTAAELGRFLRSANGERLAAAFRVAAMTGVRRGELLALTWRQIDLEAGTLAVTQQLLREADGSYRFGPPKTTRSRRLIAIDGGTVAELRAHRAAQNREKLAWGAAYSDLDLVFCREDGTPMTGDVVGWAFERAIRSAGVPRIRFHDLRHTAATLRLAAGTHPKVVQEMLGHANISITLDTYSHAVPGMQADSAEKVAALIRAAG